MLRAAGGVVVGATVDEVVGAGVVVLLVVGHGVVPLLDLVAATDVVEVAGAVVFTVVFHEV